MNYLGVDFGITKIGLAFSEGELAEPAGVIKNSRNVFADLARICREKEIGQIVLGLPGKKLALATKTFGKKLQAKTGVKLKYQDETLTSRDAVVKMIQAGRGRKFRREKEDAISAALILQNYLDDHV